MYSLTKYGIITYTIGKSNDWDKINDELLSVFDSIEEIKNHKTIGRHSTLKVFSSIHSFRSIIQNIYNLLLESLRWFNDDASISILVSYDNKIIEIITTKDEEKNRYIVQMIDNQQSKIIKENYVYIR